MQLRVEPARISRQGLEVDVHWPELRLCVEIDGGHRLRPRTRREDAARDRILTAAGYRVLRFTEDDLDRRPPWVAAQCQSAGSPT